MVEDEVAARRVIQNEALQLKKADDLAGFGSRQLGTSHLYQARKL
jgi:hypothetical protein